LSEPAQAWAVRPNAICYLVAFLSIGEPEADQIVNQVGLRSSSLKT